MQSPTGPLIRTITRVSMPHQGSLAPSLRLEFYPSTLHARSSTSGNTWSLRKGATADCSLVLPPLPGTQDRCCERRSPIEVLVPGPGSGADGFLGSRPTLVWTRVDFVIDGQGLLPAISNKTENMLTPPVHASNITNTGDNAPPPGITLILPENVTTEQVMRVRYAWEAYPACALYNGGGIGQPRLFDGGGVAASPWCRIVKLAVASGTAVGDGHGEASTLATAILFTGGELGAVDVECPLIEASGIEAMGGRQPSQPVGSFDSFGGEGMDSTF